MIQAIDMIYLLAPAFIIGVMISLIHIPLGIDVLKRGIIFLDLAIAQCAGLGMIVWHVFFENHHHTNEYSLVASLLFGLGVSLICAWGLHRIEKYAGQYQEALIGSIFVVAASVSVLLLSQDPHGGENIKDILAGQILWLTWHDVVFYSPVYAVILTVWIALKRYQLNLFYMVFAVVIPFSVQLIGVYLVFASLVLPALATVRMNKNRIVAGYCISIVSFIGGLGLSFLYDIPASPMIVIVMVCVCGLIGLNNHNAL
jgi:zinc/manganese transport system permease protein